MSRAAAVILLALAWAGGHTTAQAAPSAAARSAARAPAKGPGSLSGMWFNVEFKPSARFPPEEMVLRTVDGQLPPMLPWAAQLQKQRLDEAKAGHPFATTKSECLPAGLPQSMMGPLRQGIKIVETPAEVIVLVEEMNNFRVIPLNAKHTEDPEPSFWGDSVGRWDGDTLVVDTVALTDRTTLDFIGMPHSDALRITERFRRAGPDKLELVITFDDPKTFTRPWSTRTSFALARGEPIRESLCVNNRNRSENGQTGVQLPPAR